MIASLLNQPASKSKSARTSAAFPEPHVGWWQRTTHQSVLNCSRALNEHTKPYRHRESAGRRRQGSAGDAGRSRLIPRITPVRSYEAPGDVASYPGATSSASGVCSKLRNPTVARWRRISPFPPAQRLPSCLHPCRNIIDFHCPHTVVLPQKPRCVILNTYLFFFEQTGQNPVC